MLVTTVLCITSYFCISVPNKGRRSSCFIILNCTCSVPKARLGGIVFQFTVIAMTKKKKSLPSASAKGEQSKALNRKIHLPSVLTSSMSLTLLWNFKLCRINYNLFQKSSGLNHSNDCLHPFKKSVMLLTITV